MFLKTYFEAQFERIIFCALVFSVRSVLLMRVKYSKVLHKQLICSSYMNTYGILCICF